MKTARLALLSSLLLFFLLTACTNEMAYSPDEELRNQYTVTWVKTFGIIDAEQDWNMATSITADIDPSAFGPGYTVNIYNADPTRGGVLIGRTAQSGSLNLDVAKSAETVFVRAYSPDHGVYIQSEYPIVNGKVDIRANSRAELPISRADGSEDPAGYQWILACEDLGSIGDYDFNDIVIGVNYVAGDGKLTVTPLAAGGVYEAIVKYGDTDLFEIHNSINGMTALTGKYAMLNTKTWGGPGTPSEATGVSDFTITDKMGGLKVRVVRSGGAKEVETLIAAPTTGAVPQIICVPGDWEWPKEQVNIQTAYPQFTDWSKNSASSDWNAAKVDGKVVKRTATTPVVKNNSFVGTTSDSNPYTVYINGTAQTVNSGERVYLTEPLTSMTFGGSKDEKFFLYDTNLETLDFSDLDTSNMTSMSCMFAGAKDLTSIDFGDIDTSNVTDMSYMFYDCRSLTSVDLSKFDTSNVTNMLYMFEGCSSLTSLNLTTFDTSNVTNMKEMFKGAKDLTSINFGDIDTSNVTDMRLMFYYCSSLTSVDLSNFDTSNVKDMGSMFEGCSSLTRLDLSNFDTSNVTYMSGMFKGCSSLTSLDLSNFDTSNVKDTGMYGVFEGCSSLTSLDLSNFDTSNVTSMMYMFDGCSSLTSLDLSNFDTSNVTNMQCMFDGCSSLASLDLSKFDTSNVTSMGCMFYSCSSLTSLDLSNFDTSNVTEMWRMFEGCSSLTSLDLSKFDTSNVTSMDWMFEGCSSLASLDLTNFATSKVQSMGSMFKDCSSLTSLNLSSFITDDVGKTYSIYYTYGMKEMFSGCTSLMNLNIAQFSTVSLSSPVDNLVAYTSDMFKDCPTGMTIITNSTFKTTCTTNSSTMELPSGVIWQN